MAEVKEIGFFFRPVGLKVQENKEPTEEDVKSFLSTDPAPSFLSKTTYGTYIGLGGLVLGLVGWITGKAKDSGFGKWVGGLLTLAGIVTAGIGQFAGVKATPKESSQEAKGDEGSANKTGKQEAEKETQPNAEPEEPQEAEPTPEGLIKVIVDKTKSKKEGIEALESLKKLPDAQDKISELIKLLDDKESLVRSSAALMLGRLGAKEATPKLIKLLDDKESRVKVSAKLALRNLGWKEDEEKSPPPPAA